MGWAELGIGSTEKQVRLGIAEGGKVKCTALACSFGMLGSC